MTERERVAGAIERLLITTEELSSDLEKFVATLEGAEYRVAVESLLSPSTDLVRKLRRMKYEIGINQKPNGDKS